ncbi:MAG: ketopantoate reductase family protein [Pseudomonadota bacterium]|jgi:2-dehydropantoate 2-reductase
MTDSVLVVGAGAIGGMVAGYLAAAGRDVHVFARGETARTVREHGLRVLTPDDREYRSRPPVHEDASTLSPVGSVLFATKAFSLGEALAAVRPAIGPQTCVAPIVNGVPWWFGSPQSPVRAVDPRGELAAAVSLERLVGAVIYSPAWRDLATATWKQTVPGQLTLGPTVTGGDPAAAKSIAALFEGAAFGAVVTDDIRRAVWSKFVTNAAFNTLCALTGARQCDVASDAGTGPIAEALMREVEALAIADGSGITGSIAERLKVAREKGIHKPSTLQDFETGRPIELGALVDAPLEMAARLGVAMPELMRVGALLRLKAITAGLLPETT